MQATRFRPVSAAPALIAALVVLAACALGPRPAAASPFAYIANSGPSDNSVSVIDVASNAVVATVPVGQGPEGATVDPSLSQAYVANRTSNTVSIIAAPSHAVTATIPVGVGPRGVAVNPAGTRLYVTNSTSGTVSVIDLATRAVIASVGVGAAPYSVATSPDGSKVYVTNLGGAEISVIDAGSNTVTETIPAANAWALGLNTIGSRLYVSLRGANPAVAVIDTQTHATLATIPLPLGGGRGISVGSATNRVYVALDDGTVGVVDTTTNALVGTVKVGDAPRGVALNATESRLFVTNGVSNDVSVIDTATRTVLTTVSVGTGPLSFGQFVGGVSIAACTYSIAPPSAAYAGAGGSGSVNVTAGSGCPWSASSNADWLTFPGTHAGAGSGSVAYAVAANATGGGRSGTLTVASRTFTVTQGVATCSFTLDPSQASFPAAGGNGTVNLSTGASCAWSASSSVPWLTFSGASAGTGPAAVSYTVAANPAPGPRVGSLTIGGQAFTVTQAGTGAGGGCSFSLTPTSAAVGRLESSGTVSVSTGSGCTWSAISNAPWLMVTGSGTGPGTASYTVAANPDPGQRTGSLTIADQPFPIVQAGTACGFALGSSGASLPAAGGGGSVDVLTTAGCQWSASSDQPWATITSGAAGTGPGAVGFSVAANTSPGARSTTLTIAGQAFSIAQAGSCAFSLSAPTTSFDSRGGSATVTVSTSSGCPWSATSDAPWLTLIAGASGSGPGSVTFAVAAGSSPAPRQGTLTVGGQPLVIAQSGTRCVRDAALQEALGFLEVTCLSLASIADPEAHYGQGFKHLLRVVARPGAGAGPDGVGPGLRLGAVSLLLDLDDLLGFTGAGRAGWVTFWLDSDVSAPPGAGALGGAPIGFSMAAFERLPQEDAPRFGPVYRPLSAAEPTLAVESLEIDPATRLVRPVTSGVRTGVSSTGALGGNILRGEIRRDAVVARLDAAIGDGIAALGAGQTTLGAAALASAAERLVLALFTPKRSGLADLIDPRDRRSFTSLDTPPPDVHTVAPHQPGLVAWPGGLDLDGDGTPDGVYPASTATNGVPTRLETLTVVLVSDLDATRDYYVTVEGEPAGWFVGAASCGGTLGAGRRADADRTPAMSVVRTCWQVGAIPGATAEGSLRFTLFEKGAPDHKVDEQDVAVALGAAGALSRGPLEHFVLDMYGTVLGRNPSEADLAAWTGFLRANPTPAGADALVRAFLDGPEYAARPQTPSGHVRLLYALLLGRTPDDAGLRGWEAELLRRFGIVLDAFVGSQEFGARAAAASDPAAIANLVGRYYRVVLGREPSPPEVQAWRDYLLATGDHAGVARAFFNSAEYNGRPRTLAEHVRTLYLTFLDREPEPGATGPWVDLLAAQRSGIADGFIQSAEFAATFAELFTIPPDIRGVYRVIGGGETRSGCESPADNGVSPYPPGAAVHVVGQTGPTFLAYVTALDGDRRVLGTLSGHVASAGAVGAGGSQDSTQGGQFERRVTATATGAIVAGSLTLDLSGTVAVGSRCAISSTLSAVKLP